MKKILALLIAILFISSCAKGGDVATPDEPTETTETTETTAVTTTTITATTAKPINTTKSNKESVDKKTEKRIMEYIQRYGSMPNFSDISLIDQSWVIFNCWSNAGYTEVDYEKYGYEILVKMLDIEKVAKKVINPQIKFDYNFVPSKSDKWKVYAPIEWNNELKGLLMPSAWGGNSIFYDYLDIELYKEKELYYLSCIELRVEFDSEYEWQNGDVFIGADKVGTAKSIYDESDWRIEYNFYNGREKLEKKQYILRDNGNDEKGYPLFIIDSKTKAK